MLLRKRFHNARAHSIWRKANCGKDLGDDVKEPEFFARIQVVVEGTSLVYVKSGIVLICYMRCGELRAERAVSAGTTFSIRARCSSAERMLRCEQRHFLGTCFIGKFVVSGAGQM